MDLNYWQARQMSRRGVLRGSAAGGLGLLGAALVGCGTKNAAAPTGDSGNAPRGAAAPAAEQPVVSEAFVAIQTRDAVSLEPLDANVYTIPERIGLVYPKLLSSVLENKSDPTSNKWVPSYVVESWETVGTQITFKLKKGIKYQNIAPLNGREFTSADVKFSLDRYMKHPKSSFASRFGDISSIETPDKYTVVLKLTKPSRYLVSSLGAETALISPPEIEADYKTKAIGPGPFIHEEYLQGEGSKLKKNPDYVDAAHVYYNRYLFKVITDAATRNAALKTNQVDFIDSAALSRADLKSVEGPAVTTYPLLSVNTYNLTFNMKNPKWADYRARLALSKAFDRQAIIDQTLQADGKWTGIVQTDFGKWALPEADIKAHNVQKYDPTEAKKLWDAAGKPGMSNEFYYSPNGNTYGVMSQLMAKQWETNLGIKTTLKTEDYSIYLPKMYLGLLGPGGGYSDLCITHYGIPNWMEHLFAPYLKGGNRNGSNFEDAKVTAMLDDLKQTLDDKEAVEKSRKAQLYIWENHLPMTQLPTPNYSSGYNAKLREFLPGNYPPGLEWTVNSWKAK